MPRNPYVRSTDFPYHITARCHGKMKFPLPLGRVWELFQEEFHLAHRLHALEIHSLVLMPNHFHLLARDPSGQLSECMHRSMLSLTKRINGEATRIGNLWSARFYRCLIKNPHYYLNAYKYVYFNPVKAKLCHRAEAWPYSTLHGTLGQSHLLIPTIEDENLFRDLDGTLRWINRAPKDEHWNTMKYAFRRKEFYLPRLMQGQDSSHPLEIERL